MAKKSKTQRAKASVKRAEKKVQLDAEAEELTDAANAAKEVSHEEKKGLKNLFKKSSNTANSADTASKKPMRSESKAAAKVEKDAKKSKRFAFFKEVRAEMKRVTWPPRQDIVRWSGVVVVALVFFGLFVFVLDNWVVTPLLLVISSLGA